MAITVVGNNNTLRRTATSQSITLTTTAAGRIIVVGLQENATAYNHVTSVTATGLTFTQRSASVGTGGRFQTVDVWYADTASTFSGTITVNWSATFDACVIFAFGLHSNVGAISWDTNASLPATHNDSDGVAQATVSTDSTVPFVLAIFGDGVNSGNNGPTATTMTPAGVTQWDSRTVVGAPGAAESTLWGGGQLTGALSSVSVGWTTNTNTTGVVVVDALAEPAGRGWVVGAITLN